MHLAAPSTMLELKSSGLERQLEKLVKGQADLMDALDIVFYCCIIR